MTEQVTENKDLADAPQQAPAQESNDLNVNDLNAMKTIIDLASSRGAFKASEMMAVGQVYNKLSSFLASVSKQPNQGA
jgi:hypothetical protein